MRPDKMSSTIKQHSGEQDCFLRCMAMAAGMTWNEALSRWHPDFVRDVKVSGLYGHDRIRGALSALGIYEKDCRLHFAQHWLENEQLSAITFRSLLWGRRALLQVPSKNIDGTHIVYWDGERLHDPSPGATYLWEEVEPQFVWLLK